MYLCQQIETMTDARYRRDRRVAWFRVELQGERLVWVRHRNGPWRCNLHRRGRNGCDLTGTERARRDFLKGVAELPGVRHNGKVSAAKAAKLTGLAGFAALDFLHELGPEGLAHPEVVKLPVKLKTAPSPADVAATKLAKAEAKVKELTTRIKRLETHRKKWSRRVNYYTARTAKIKAEK